MSNRFQSAKRWNFSNGGAAGVHFKMRVFLMLARGLVAGDAHADFRRNAFVRHFGIAGVAQTVKRAAGKHPLARALHGLQIQARLRMIFFEGFGKSAPSAHALAGKLGHHKFNTISRHGVSG